MRILDDLPKGSGLPPIFFTKKPMLSTGLLSFDYVSGGGYPIGDITEIYGESGSGKTASVLRSIAHAQEEGKYCAFIDMEHSFPSSLAESSSIDSSRLFVLSPSCGEDAFSMMSELVRTDAIDLLALDSVTALISKDDLERRVSEQEDTVSSLLKRQLPEFLTLVTASNTAEAAWLADKIDRRPHGEALCRPPHRDILRGDAGRKRQDGWTRSPMRRNEEPLHIPGQESFLRRIQRHRGGRCPILRRCCRTPRQAVFHGSMLHPFQRQGIPKLFRPSFLSQSRRKSLF